MRRCGRVGTPMAVPCGASVTDCSGGPASFSDGGCCSIPTMVRPPLRRLQRSRRLTLSLPQPALQQSAARKCCPGGRERPRRQAPARSVLDDTSTALRSMSEDNARHVECLTAGLSGGGSAVDTLQWPRHWLGSGPCPCSSQPCTEEPRRSEWLRPRRRDDDVVLGSSLSESDEPPS